jgi:ABC-type bacteriocin/lantibiotic exporter with double-glycine peptidase domain
LCCLGFIAVYKLTLGCFFSGTDHILLNEYLTHYGGVKTGTWTEFIQTDKETCGHATAAFFLTAVGLPTTENSIIRRTGTASMLSLADLDDILVTRGLKTQLLKVSPAYLKKNPQSAILHFTESHFVVFLRGARGEALLFDPAYGQVYVSWKTLTRIFRLYE